MRGAHAAARRSARGSLYARCGRQTEGNEPVIAQLSIRLRVALAAALALALVLAGYAIRATVTGNRRGEDKVVTIVVGGLSRSYRLFVPTTLATGKAPLIIALHPLHGSAERFESDTDFDSGAAHTGALVAYPAGYAHSWNAGTCCGQAHVRGVDDVAFLDAVVDDIEAHYPVDPQRIAIGGFSNGAMMSYRYLCARSARVHSAFIGSGALMSRGCRFSHPVQIVQFHGLSDPVLPWAGLASASLETAVRADGCSGQWRSRDVGPLVKRSDAEGCRAGASVVALRSQPLVHGWVTGRGALSTYGIDETEATWSWLATIWSSRRSRGGAGL